jgi:LysR family hydrogen peroxide-inducible transcriptional activator
LIAVHDLNNFSKAAERCSVSQPTLSGQLKKLEGELNAPLIERTTRQVLFTALGEQIVALAREVLLTVDSIRATAKANEKPMVGDFHIGLIPTIGPFLLPIVMPVFSRHFPDAKLYLHELQTETLLAKLSRGEIDAAILAKVDKPSSLCEIPLYRETMKLAVCDDDPLSDSQTPVNLSILNNRSVLMLDDGHCLRQQVLVICSAVGAHEDSRFQATSLDTLLHMVATGYGLTLIPDLASRRPMQGVSYLPFNHPQPSREIVMLLREHTVRKSELESIASCVTETVNRAPRRTPRGDRR